LLKTADLQATHLSRQKEPPLRINRDGGFFIQYTTTRRKTAVTCQI